MLKFRKWFHDHGEIKKEQILLLLLGGILLAVITFPGNTSLLDTGTQKEKETNVQETASEATTQIEQLEQRLAQILAQVEGIGKVSVMISRKSSGTQLVEKDRSYSEQTSSSATESQSVLDKKEDLTTVYTHNEAGEEIPFVMERMEPEVTGVLVVAEGGDDPVVIEKITNAVEALFSLEAHKIKVMKAE